MKLNELAPPRGAKKAPKRVGRGVGSGHGKTSCRGSKGQKSRTGGNVKPGFEGGQMPLQRRLPKRGFCNVSRKDIAVINVRDLNRFESSATIDESVLKEAGLVRCHPDGIKLLGQGAIDRSVVVRVSQCSSSARAKVESAGGRVELV